MTRILPQHLASQRFLRIVWKGLAGRCDLFLQLAAAHSAAPGLSLRIDRSQSRGGSPLGDLQVMLVSNQRAVPNLRANDVDWKLLCEFRLSAREEVVEDSRPRRQSCSFDDPGEL